MPKIQTLGLSDAWKKRPTETESVPAETSASAPSTLPEQSTSEATEPASSESPAGLQSEAGGAETPPSSLAEPPSTPEESAVLPPPERVSPPEASGASEPATTPEPNVPASPPAIPEVEMQPPELVIPPATVSLPEPQVEFAAAPTPEVELPPEAERAPVPDSGFQDQGVTEAPTVADWVINPEAASPPEPSLPPPPQGFSVRRFFGQLVFLILVVLSAAFGVVAGLVFVHSADLPQIRQLMDYRPDVITELYADDGTPIGNFALEHRVIVSYNEIPQVLKDAVLSVEDRHFESHWGVDVVRVVRAAMTDLLEWRRAQGASTLTMQLSKVLFLTRERKFKRKFQEVLIAIQIERHFTKAQIFTMYANQVALGHGNYGFAAAAQFYFGKRLDQLTLPEAALLAGLPRTPTGYSPLLHPDRARQRRNQVLAAMRENGKITDDEFRAARAAPLGLNIQRWNRNVAAYFVEDVRLFLEDKYGTEAVHEKGLRVSTTLNLKMQEIAERALRNGLRTYDKRHGWRGAEANIIKNPPTLTSGLLATLETYTHPDWQQPLEAGNLVHGLVMEVSREHAVVRFGERTARVTAPDVAWTGKKISELFVPGDVDLFLVHEVKGETLRVTLDQQPEVQGALVAIENSTGAIKAMVGGYDFEDSKFNRARQAVRQAGSSFKPYVYAAVLMDGGRPFDTIVDEPVSFPSASGPWSPRNYDGKYEGTVTLLHALAESRNIPAVKLLDRVGVDKVIRLCRKFGLTTRLVPNLPLALGASDLTLLEHTSAFSTFPNDGVHVSPRTILRVTDYDGRVIEDFQPEVTDVLPAPIARLETSMLREVFFSGTATRARALAEKYPMAGKTGTTNDFVDAGFVGFTPSLTCGVWVGYDDRRTLGNKEEGARVALPIWMEFMESVLKDRPAEDFSYSPRLTNPDQVDQILASAGAERLMAESPAAQADAAIKPEAAPQQPATPTRKEPPTPPAKPAAQPAATTPTASVQP